jgi:hypothetical protein
MRCIKGDFITGIPLLIKESQAAHTFVKGACGYRCWLFTKTNAAHGGRLGTHTRITDVCANIFLLITSFKGLHREKAPKRDAYQMVFSY